MKEIPRQVLKAWPPPDELFLELGSRAVGALKIGRPVSRGQLLGPPRKPRDGLVHSPLNGYVTAIGQRSVTIKVDSSSIGLPPRPMAIEGLVGSDLEEALRSLGVDLPIAPPPGEPAIISALVPEPGLDCAWVLWEDQLATLKAGAAVLRRLWPDGEFIEVVSPRSAPLGLGRLARCSERYPYTLPPLVKRKILGTWDPLARGMVEPSDLWAIGSVARSGLPLTSAPITIQYSSYLAPFGVRVSEALSQMNLSPLPGDVVVLGGLVRGRPTARLEMGLSKSTKALHLIRSSSLIDSYGLCLGCGRCAASCPLELPMDLLAQAPVNQWPETASRYSELLSGCLACGACALACPSSRPLLSLALMTKRTDRDDAARRQIGTACESPLS